MKEKFYSEITNHLLFTLFDGNKPQKVDLFRIHHHTELEIGYILSGEGIYILEDEQYKASPGDLFLIRTNEQHCVPTIFTPSLVSFNIYFEPYFLWNVCADFIDSQYLHTLVNTNIPMKHKFKGQDKTIDLLMNLLEDPVHNRYLIKRTVLDLLIDLMKEVTLTHHINQTTVVSNQLNNVQKAMNFIHEHLTEAITLDDIAHAAAISRASLSSSFKKINGISPYEYLLIKRIEKSLTLLKTTDTSILGIAQESGFKNLTNFNRIFKKINGITPKDYRKIQSKII